MPSWKRSAHSNRALVIGMAWLCLGLGHGSVLAEPPVDDTQGDTGFALFVDSMDTTIWTPYANLSATVLGNVELDVAWAADVITSASVDVITAATSSMTETRHSLTASGRSESVLADLDLTGSYTYSFERDYTSHAGVVGLSRGFLQDNTEISINYGVSVNRAGVVGEPMKQWRDLTVHSLETTWTQVLNRRTVFALVGSSFVASGYQANPYRRVPILMGRDLRSASWVSERVPDRRLRFGLTPQVRRALGDSWLVSASYRFYFDDWGIMSHTANLDGMWNISPKLALRLHHRSSWQGNADFYQERYTQALEYRTRDRRLSRHISGVLGTTLLWEIQDVPALGTLDLHLGVDALAWRYNEFFSPSLDTVFGAELETLGWVRGVIVQLGIEVKI